ncbi:MAG: hypothetical protein ACI4XM_07530 [Candidatus Coprovivens sp.]
MVNVIEMQNLLAKKYIVAYLEGEEYPLDMSMNVGMRIFNFEKNFLEQYGTTPLNDNMRNHSEEAASYLNRTYPYSFIDGYKEKSIEVQTTNKVK